VKRADLARWLRAHDCYPVAEQRRGKHEAWRNEVTGETSFVPRHREIGVGVARKICRQLGIPPIAAR
jgi:mRNA interferase HicA